MPAVSSSGTATWSGAVSASPTLATSCWSERTVSTTVHRSPSPDEADRRAVRAGGGLTDSHRRRASRASPRWVRPRPRPGRPRPTSAERRAPRCAPRRRPTRGPARARCGPPGTAARSRAAGSGRPVRWRAVRRSACPAVGGSGTALRRRPSRARTGCGPERRPTGRAARRRRPHTSRPVATAVPTMTAATVSSAQPIQPSRSGPIGSRPPPWRRSRNSGRAARAGSALTVVPPDQRSALPPRRGAADAGAGSRRPCNVFAPHPTHTPG